jgi:hypothetical protein
MRVTSFLVALLVILTPFIAFADPDCSSLPPEARATQPSMHSQCARVLGCI